MMGFVAKQEIRGWPVVGWLTARGETIFHQRGSQESMGGVMHAMLARLQAGRPVGVFPEGRTRDGAEVGPFHARIFQPAVEASVPVQPVALRYGRRGSAQTVVAFEPPRSADICFLTPIAAGELEGRSRIADLARERIVAAMDSDA
jgi:1-acyl-sn-glycerol-3-phosphate acyltransferase